MQLELLIASKKPGEKLITEPELARQLGVSRATLREAMRTFETRGVIYRRQGAGTFISDPKIIESGLEVLESIETLSKRMGLKVSWQNMQIQELQPNSVTQEKLDISDGELVTKISRVVAAENRPVAFLIDILPKNILSKENLTENFSGSVLDFLLNRGTPTLHYSHTEISAVAPPPEVIKPLRVHRNDVLIYLQAQLYSQDGRVVDLSHSYFLPGFFRFHVVRRVNHTYNT